uniref:TSA: Wollemia nobilis Ref_Wollemi_Transcript_8241_1363 transcribed RNA sequence n=1 Tax=Wollemia nobilis TaxID=56998 RepID=A0A0C9S7L2_9CONI
MKLKGSSSSYVSSTVEMTESSGNSIPDKGKSESKNGEIRFPLAQFEVAALISIFCVFLLGLLCIYLMMPDSEFQFLKLPQTVEDLQILKNHLASYTKDYTAQVILGYCATYIFMQTFMIPGTIFMSLLAGALFGVVRGLVLVVSTATAGASSCYFLSKLIGRPIALCMWPDKLRFFRAEVAKRRENLLNYMLFLRITPTLPNTFINVASPIVDVPYHIFFLATIFGLIPAAFVTVRAGLALGDLKSLGDLYDTKTICTLFFIGLMSIVPTLVTRNKRSM